MFKKLAVLAATVAGAGALAVGGAAVASAAPLPVVHEVTTVTYTAHQAELDVTSGFTPGNGTIVTFDLEAALNHGQGSTSLNAEILSVLSGLNLPGVDVHNAPMVGQTSTQVPDTTLTLSVVDAHAHSFEVAAGHNGTPIVLPSINPGTGHATVTWNKFVAPVNHAPYVYNGHRLTVSAHSATVGWSDSQFGWPTATNGVLGNHCVMVFIYGFDKPAGQAHIGFTCDNGNPAGNVGYLSDLAAGHSVSLFVQPAEGSYLNHHVIPGTSPKAHIDVVTPAV